MTTVLPNGELQSNPRIAYNKGHQQGKAEGVEEVLKNIEIGIEATGHSDQYTTGFCNALIWLKSCITNEEPMFLEQLKEQNK